MLHIRKIFANLMLVSIMLFGQPLGFAAPVNDDDDNGKTRLQDTLRLKNVSLPWAFPLGHPDVGGSCAAIPATLGFINPVDDTSDRVRKTKQTMMADGSQVIVWDDRISGTAVDSNENTYQFLYKNGATLHVSPGQSPTVDVRMTDLFRIKGNGFQMKVTFDWSWTYTAQQGVAITLDPFVGFPIIDLVFATADGINPAPGVTNWVQLETEGDPFNCDPL